MSRVLEQKSAVADGAAVADVEVADAVVEVEVVEAGLLLLLLPTLAARPGGGCIVC